MKCNPRLLWSLGQTLLPEHMRGLEESILSDASCRSEISGLPVYGFSSVRLSKSLESDGLLTLEKGIMITHSGRLLVIGENATINTINLNAFSQSKIKVYIHLLKAEAIEKSPMLNMKMETDLLPTWKWNLHLSYDITISGTVEYLMLGVFEKDIHGQWRMSDEYFPPLFQLGNGDILFSELTELITVLDKYLQSLLEESANIQLSGENLINVKRCLINVRVFRNYIKNIVSQIHPHPYFFYEKIQQFYFELCSYQGVDSLIADKIYNHDNLSACIGELISATSQLLQKDRMVIPMHEFIDVSGAKVVEMSVAASSALHWYILVQKQNIHQKINIESVKFACQSRLSIVHKYFLQGVPIKQIDRPVFQHYFGPEVDTYEVMKGEEWNQVLLENNVAFICDASFEGARFYLYWSNV